jgi:cysteine desulfurase
MMGSSDATIYLDYAASTPVDARVWERMREVSERTCANPSSTHAAGRLTHEIIATAAGQLGGLLNADPGTLIWTSGATESDNLAIAGGARYRAQRGRHIVTMRTEHKAVTDVFERLGEEGFEVTWVEPGPTGVLDPAAFEAALRADTQLASIMFVNNETGVIQDIEALGRICRERDVLFHVDAAQAAGKLPIDLAALPVDLMSVTAHKFYGPKGIGALYIADRQGCHVDPILFGGGQQRRIRPGTLPTELIAGFGETAKIAAHRMESDLAHLRAMRGLLWDGIRDLDGLLLNGNSGGFPGILNVSADGVEGESLLLALEPLVVATGSACNSRSQEPSYVLRALGRSDREAQSAIRFSVGRPTTGDEVRFAARRYREAVTRLRALVPAA